MERQESTEVRRLRQSNAELLDVLRSFIALCPSAEGLGGHAPIGAFFVIADKARKIISEMED